LRERKRNGAERAREREGRARHSEKEALNFNRRALYFREKKYVLRKKPYLLTREAYSRAGHPTIESCLFFEKKVLTKALPSDKRGLHAENRDLPFYEKALYIPTKKPYILTKEPA